MVHHFWALPLRRPVPCSICNRHCISKVLCRLDCTVAALIVAWCVHLDVHHAPKRNSFANFAIVNSPSHTIYSSTNARTPMNGRIRVTYATKHSGDKITFGITGMFNSGRFLRSSRKLQWSMSTWLKIPFFRQSTYCLRSKRAFQIRMYEKQQQQKFINKIYTFCIYKQTENCCDSLSYQISNFIAEPNPNRITDIGCAVHVWASSLCVCILCT